MMKKKPPQPQTPVEYECLFCGGRFTAEQVLFADEIENAKEAAPDPVLSRFFDGFIRAPQKAPTQLIHSWNELPKTSLTIRKGEVIPASIRVRRKGGVLPTVDEPEQQVSGNDTDQAMGALSRLSRGVNAAETPVQLGQPNLQATVRQFIMADHVATLTKRICPHCHCTVPDGIGQSPVYRIAMLGGSASGKTTYMILAASQMVRHEGNTLNNLLQMAEGWLVGESNPYFKELYAAYMEDRLEGTQKDTATYRPVFPMVLKIKPRDGYKPFFLVIQDFPGEGMQDLNFLANSTGILRAHGAILLVDPAQMMAFGLSNARTRQPEGQHCLDPLSVTCEILNPQLWRFEKLQRIVLAINKLDCLYQATPPQTPVLQLGSFPQLDEGNLMSNHKGMISQSALDNLHQTVLQICTRLPDNTAQLQDEAYYVNLRTMLGLDQPDSPALSLKAVSSYSWRAGDDGQKLDIQKKRSIGHRLLEPVLDLLGHADLLPMDKSANVAQVSRRRFWAR